MILSIFPNLMFYNIRFIINRQNKIFWFTFITIEGIEFLIKWNKTSDLSHLYFTKIPWSFGIYNDKTADLEKIKPSIY